MSSDGAHPEGADAGGSEYVIPWSGATEDDDLHDFMLDDTDRDHHHHHHPGTPPPPPAPHSDTTTTHNSAGGKRKASGDATDATPSSMGDLYDELLGDSSDESYPGDPAQPAAKRSRLQLQPASAAVSVAAAALPAAAPPAPAAASSRSRRTPVTFKAPSVVYEVRGREHGANVLGMRDVLRYGRSEIAPAEPDTPALGPADVPAGMRSASRRGRSLGGNSSTSASSQLHSFFTQDAVITPGSFQTLDRPTVMTPRGTEALSVARCVLLLLHQSYSEEDDCFDYATEDDPLEGAASEAPTASALSGVPGVASVGSPAGDPADSPVEAASVAVAFPPLLGALPALRDLVATLQSRLAVERMQCVLNRRVNRKSDQAPPAGPGEEEDEDDDDEDEEVECSKPDAPADAGEICPGGLSNDAGTPLPPSSAGGVSQGGVCGVPPPPALHISPLVLNKSDLCVISDGRAMSYSSLNFIRKKAFLFNDPTLCPYCVVFFVEDAFAGGGGGDHARDPPSPSAPDRAASPEGGADADPRDASLTPSPPAVADLQDLEGYGCDAGEGGVPCTTPLSFPSSPPEGVPNGVGRMRQQGQQQHQPQRRRHCLERLLMMLALKVHKEGSVCVLRSSEVDYEGFLRKIRSGLSGDPVADAGLWEAHEVSVFATLYHEVVAKVGPAKGVRFFVQLVECLALLPTTAIVNRRIYVARSADEFTSRKSAESSGEGVGHHNASGGSGAAAPTLGSACLQRIERRAELVIAAGGSLDHGTELPCGAKVLNMNDLADYAAEDECGGGGLSDEGGEDVAQGTAASVLFASHTGRLGFLAVNN